MREKDTVTFFTEDGQEEFYVLEQTMLSGINYLLVTDSPADEEEGEFLILKEVPEKERDEEDAIVEIVEDDKELSSVMKIFAELLEDIDLEV